MSSILKLLLITITLMFVLVFLNSFFAAALIMFLPPYAAICSLELFEFQINLSQMLWELMPGPVPSGSVGGWWSLVHGDPCCLCTAIVVEGSTKADSCNCTCFIVETQTEYFFCNISSDYFGTVSDKQLRNKPLESRKNSLYQRMCVCLTDL